MLIDDLRQRHLEKFEEEYWKLADNIRGRNRDNGATVRAAQAAGWLKRDPGPVGDMKPADVRRLAEAINARYTELTTIDPNS